MLNHIKLDHVYVIDIETVPQQQHFDKLSPQQQELWEAKSAYQRSNQSAAEFYDKAGIWAEFGKIVCVSVGVFYLQKKDIHLRINSFVDFDEKAILNQFIHLLKDKKDIILCAHNGKEFDFPYLCRRMLINSLEIPEILQINNKKPWEIKHLDTLELWKFGDYKHYTSLNLLAQIFDLPTPKGDMDGSKVKDTYYNDRDLPKIAKYCENDVITTAQILLKFKGLQVIRNENIISVKQS